MRAAAAMTGNQTHGPILIPLTSCILAQVAYIMDALRYREGALGAIWITLGLVNLSMLVSEASFGGPSPLILSAAVSLCSGSTLFLVGAPLPGAKSIQSRGT